MRRIVVVVVAVALALVGITAFVLTRPGSPDEGGRLAAPPSPVIENADDVEITRTPAAWHIVYRLEEHGSEDDDLTVSTDKVWVRRPFESRLETWSGPPPGDKAQFVQVGWFARRGTKPVDAERLVLRLPPAGAPSDIRLRPILSAAEEYGLIERREVREVARRRCQVLRSGALLSAPYLQPPTEDSYADSCVDAAGLVLEETLVDAGKVLSRRLAVKVDEDPDLDDVELEMSEGEPLPAKEGGGVVQPLTLDSRAPGEFFELTAPPAGFTHQGRYSVVPPQPENFSDFSREGFIFGGVTDVYVRGEDFIVLDQWGTLRGQDPPAPPPAIDRVDIPLLGTGGVALSGAGSELRFDLPGGRLVRLTGSLEPDELTRIARELVMVEGGELVPLAED